MDSSLSRSPQVAVAAEIQLIGAIDPDTPLAEQVGQHAMNMAGMSAEEAAVAAFLRMRRGELEQQQKETGKISTCSPVGAKRPPRRSRGTGPAQSSELLHNHLN